MGSIIWDEKVVNGYKLGNFVRDLGLWCWVGKFNSFLTRGFFFRWELGIIENCIYFEIVIIFVL